MLRARLTLAVAKKANVNGIFEIDLDRGFVKSGLNLVQIPGPKWFASFKPTILPACFKAPDYECFFSLFYGLLGGDSPTTSASDTTTTKRLSESELFSINRRRLQ